MTPPIFLARRKSEGSWYIEITWPNGKTEEAGNFPTAAEAGLEIKIRLEAWQEGTKRYETPHPASRSKALAGQ
jgi:hypothetical protein